MTTTNRAEETMGEQVAAIVGQVTIMVDYENNAESWWTSARSNQAKTPKCLDTILFGNDYEVTVDAATAASAADWCAAIDGWSDEAAPRYAPHPLLFQPADVDSSIHGDGDKLDSQDMGD